jgi:hypothetical protein
MAKNYYIYDSNLWVITNNTCPTTSNSNTSKVVYNVSTPVSQSGYTVSSAKTEIEIQEYISDLQTYIFGLIRINPSLMNASNANQISSDSTKITYNQKGPNQNRELIPSRNKPLCQLVADLNSLITTFNSVINTSQNPYDMTKKNPIYTKYNENINLRNELQEEIDRIYGKKNNSKLYLDSIVYTSVLWTILATTILFYIFKKL